LSRRSSDHDLPETPLLAVETVVLGTEEEAKSLEPWKDLCSEASRVIWNAQTSLESELAVAFIPGPAPTQDGKHRIVVGGYSPETKTVLVFIESLEKVRRDRSYLRQLMRTLAHEVTHAVQHREHPGLRPGRLGSVTLDAESYARDPLERAAVAEEAAFDHVLFSESPPAETLARVSAYRKHLTARLFELIHELEK
jgi:hypothetical protein